MNALFGEDRAQRLRQQLQPLSPAERERLILDEIAEALREMGGKNVLPFGFKHERRCRASHYLIFVCKHFKGYEIMKEIMAEKSARTNQGVPSYEYSLAEESQTLLLELAHPLDNLEGMLLTGVSGRKLPMGQIYQVHGIGRPYLRRNYKAVLRKLEAEAKISASPPAAQRRKMKGEVTFADEVLVTFPSSLNN